MRSSRGASRRGAGLSGCGSLAGVRSKVEDNGDGDESAVVFPLYCVVLGFSDTTCFVLCAHDGVKRRRRIPLDRFRSGGFVRWVVVVARDDTTL